MESQMFNFGYLSVPTPDMAPRNFRNQSNPSMLSSSMINHAVIDEDRAVSDSESSSVSEGNPKKYGRFVDELVRIEEGEREHETIKLSVLAGLSSWGLETRIKELNRVGYSGFRRSARLEAFGVFANAVEQSCGGDANVKYAWYGASMEDIMKIVLHGFSDPPDTGMFGRGVYLSPVEHIIDSLQSTIVDGDGARHLMLCRVLMGRMEQVPAGTKQCYPSSKDFDSGVDNLTKPRKYIVWGTHMNTHILPKFVVSVGNVNNSQVARSQQVSVPKPNSPWLPFQTLISELARFLQPHAMKLIMKFHNDHNEKKLSRFELIQRVRHIAGDELLASVIKSYRQKKFNLSAESVHNATNKSLQQGGRRRG